MKSVMNLFCKLPTLKLLGILEYFKDFSTKKKKQNCKNMLFIHTYFNYSLFLDVVKKVFLRIANPVMTENECEFWSFDNF